MRCFGGSPTCLRTSDREDFPMPLTEWRCWGCWLWMHPIRQTFTERLLSPWRRLPGRDVA